ncbi:hypothetical protein [Fodinibius halophilus]|uniref:Uncharacterized protein n=1 Tax=Fodinibius halophilus TaxID=1736908 RepID=A0A6M1T6J5_9BACT|nr:hypothetical protein [Fodinibius halophilus]NGP87641.1 hypothetical protein [Fodinibius halophilus]
MQFFKNTFLISLLLLAIGWAQENENTKQEVATKAVGLQDSVLFVMDGADFQAKFSNVGNAVQGKATGPMFFQRYGDLNYILDELYVNNPIKVLDNPHTRQNYKVEIRWKESTDFESARDSVLSRMQNYFNYNIHRDSIKQKQYALSVDAAEKLEQAATNQPKEKVEFKSEMKNGQWDVQATLPRFAKALSEQTNKLVKLKDKHGDQLYRFKLDLNSGITQLQSQLRGKYGLILTINQVPVEQLTIDFGNS